MRIKDGRKDLGKAQISQVRGATAAAASKEARKRDMETFHQRTPSDMERDDLCPRPRHTNIPSFSPQKRREARQ